MVQKVKMQLLQPRPFTACYGIMVSLSSEEQPRIREEHWSHVEGVEGRVQLPTVTLPQ